MGVDGEDPGLCVEMANISHPHTSRQGTEGSILEGLQSLDVGGGGIGEPEGCGVGEEGSN